ncbi:MAG: CAAX prenyl protease-related protein, partial [Bacillota bacterium]
MARLLPGLDSRWLAIGRSLVAALLLAVYWPRYAELRAAPVRGSDVALAIGLGLAAFGAWIAFDRGWALTGGAGVGFVPLRADGSLDPVLVLLRLAGLALVVPVMEELFWRSFVLRWIANRDFLCVDPRHAGALAFALSSALFASEHSLWFAGLLAGLAYGACYMRSGNLWIPILSHAITNATLGLWILAKAQ